MTTSELIAHAEALRTRIQPFGRSDGHGRYGDAAKAQVCEFLRTYAGPKSAFLKQAEAVAGASSYLVATLDAIISSYIDYIKAGLASGPSPERKAQLDVVSDILSQAQQLLDDERVHAAAPAVLIGAALEEFLRTWAEAAELSIGNARPGIDAYSKCLRTAELISKQDVKDITAWAGIRNHAAHGEWDQVADRARIRLMLEAVNLFMRQKGS